MTNATGRQDLGRLGPWPARVAGALLRKRWLVRAPIWLYRARLGVLFGRRLLMLEHTGRTTGQPRYVVLEVVDQDAASFVVAAGFGGRSQWLRNLDADPHAFVSSGLLNRRPVLATRLDEAQASSALSRYAAAHPRAWAQLRPVFEDTLGEAITEDGTALPMVRLTLTRPR